jgi:hypothetical protein
MNVVLFGGILYFATSDRLYHTSIKCALYRTDKHVARNVFSPIVKCTDGQYSLRVWCLSLLIRIGSSILPGMKKLFIEFTLLMNVVGFGGIIYFATSDRMYHTSIKCVLYRTPNRFLPNCEVYGRTVFPSGLVPIPVNPNRVFSSTGDEMTLHRVYIVDECGLIWGNHIFRYI